MGPDFLLYMKSYTCYWAITVHRLPLLHVTKGRAASRAIIAPCFCFFPTFPMHFVDIVVKTRSSCMIGLVPQHHYTISLCLLLTAPLRLLFYSVFGTKKGGVYVKNTSSIYSVLSREFCLIYWLTIDSIMP